jgi:cyclic pyranopterin phosphate synthase
VLKDKYNRIADYLRIAVTDRCNLRCTYCMPEEGIKYAPKEELLSFEELLRLANIFAELGVKKVRITGGEPLIRKDIMSFIKQLSKIKGIEKINLTTNGTVTGKYLNELWDYGVRTINLSLDTLDKDRFYSISRRNDYDKVIACLHQMLEKGVKVKINCVVMAEVNVDDIIPFVEMTKEYPISVRFIEEMPFNGEGKEVGHLIWDYKMILEKIKNEYPSIIKLEDPPNSTAYHYQVPGHQGEFGIIAAYSRTFCGSCNRIRLTPQGIIKTCLYDEGIFNIKSILRAGATNEQLAIAIQEAVSGKAKNGFEAEQNRSLNFPVSESMSTIGG